MLVFLVLPLGELQLLIIFSSKNKHQPHFFTMRIPKYYLATFITPNLSLLESNSSVIMHIKKRSESHENKTLENSTF